MKFKAKLNYMAYRLNDKTEANSDKSFIFTRSQIFYSTKNRNWVLEDYEIKDGDYYELHFIDNIDRLKRYEITINKNRQIKLSLDKINEFKLKWTHKLFFIQQEKSNWLKNLIGALLIALTTFALTKLFNSSKSNQETTAPIKTDTSKSKMK